jgi:hypothetical protein
MLQFAVTTTGKIIQHKDKTSSDVLVVKGFATAAEALYYFNLFSADACN